MNNKNVNSGLTLVDVRSVLMETINGLKDGSVDVKTASEIRNLSNSMIDIAKTQIEYLKAIPNSVKEQMSVNEVKAIAGTLIDRDAELDVTMKEISESQRKPYQSNR
jgi:replicative DNA helicase